MSALHPHTACALGTKLLDWYSGSLTVHVSGCEDTPQSIQEDSNFDSSRKKRLTVDCAYSPKSSSEYLIFLEKVNQVLQGICLTDSIVLLGGFTAHAGNDGDT